jgi:serine phosphatase RsbU (regulator of sigma subunit)
VIWAVADCTGHGVPGALMSMLGHSLLNEIIADKGVVKADAILNELREKVVSMLGQKGSGVKQNDGMDIALCVMDPITRELEFAGANSPCWIARGTGLIELEPDKMPVGAYSGPVLPFRSKKVSLEPGDVVYLFTDGYADQFGGDKGKKFKYSQFKQLVASMHSEPAEKQEQLLGEAFDKWRGDLEQVDDVCVMGTRI